MSELHHRSNTWSLKVKKFFNYLASFYLISNVNATTNTRVNNRSNVAPVWRSGSKTLTPVYIIASLWNLFVLREYEQVLNKVNELILEPPFNMEGVLYFIAALCWVCNADGAVSEWKTRGENESGRRGVLEELGKCEREILRNLKKCDELLFEFPKELIVSQMKSLYDAVNTKKADQESSASEMEEDEAVNDSDDVDWGAISSDSSDNDDEEEEKRPVSPIPAQPTQLDDMNDANYSDDEEEEEVRESLKRVDRTADSIEINGDTQRDQANGSVEEIPASQPLFYADTQRIALPDTQRINSLPDTQPIEFEEEDYEDDMEMREDEERNGHAFGSFDTRRNSLELYSTKSSSIEPDFKRNNTKLQSQQTMLDFDFDFDSDSN
ncbi:hypothetical protein Cantr_09320 [Candida viswanathii]|uniref:Uncharacterized protein n=1 Tax=Candida viswanathii TaxID=5486 RepID=A0A367YAM0_9ASCO|nr:hypothetical protein Cantr_09320 [Candida viswanathii]